MFEPDTKFL